MDRILRAFVGFFRAIANVPEALAAFRTGYVKGASDVRREKGAVFPTAAATTLKRAVILAGLIFGTIRREVPR